MSKTNLILVKDAKIKTLSDNGIDYVCITDIELQKNEENPNGVIANWMRNRNTIEFLGIWECLYNPSFKPLEFEGFRKEAGLNAITLSPKNVFNNASFLVYNIACEFRDLHDRSDVKCKERKV